MITATFKFDCDLDGCNETIDCKFCNTKNVTEVTSSYKTAIDDFVNENGWVIYQDFKNKLALTFCCEKHYDEYRKKNG